MRGQTTAPTRFRWHPNPFQMQIPPDARIEALRARMSRGAPEKLRRLLLDALVEAGRYEEAIALADQSGIASGTDTRWDINLATALERAGQSEAAAVYAAAAVAAAPTDSGVALFRVGLLIRRRDASALLALDDLIDRFHVRLSPAMLKLLRDQRGIAYLCALAEQRPDLFRPGDQAELAIIRAVLAGRPESVDPMMDVDRLVRREVLCLGDADAMTRLGREIESLPRVAADPNSDATAAGLKMGAIPPRSERIDRALAAIRDAVERHCEALAQLGCYPAMPRDIVLKAWTVVLAKNGRALSHNHPAGCLSGVLYVATPAVTVEAGALLMPLPPAGVDDWPWPTRTLVPGAGELILFPSYFRHATLPHDSDDARISIAFDILPSLQ
ncbi:MAG: hypothetical protein EOP58_02200 [Sphingomonadales bacterium]|nr:MAG: hypothetical protein EOP58_02200 [Sphingomonadales bacterium]